MGVRGLLKDLRLADLIRIFHSERKTVILRLSSDKGEGLICIENGEVVHAAADGLAGPEAFYRLFSWRDGDFEVKEGEAAPHRTIRERMSALLSEAANRRGMDRPAAPPEKRSLFTVKGDTAPLSNPASNASPPPAATSSAPQQARPSSFVAVPQTKDYDKLVSQAAAFAFWKEAEEILSSQEPVERRLDLLARRLKETLKAIVCNIYLCDDAGRYLSLGGTSHEERPKGPFNVPSAEWIEGSALESMDDVFLVDRGEAKVKRAYLALPMRLRELKVGVINIQVASEQGLSFRDELFLKEVREIAAASIHRAIAVEKVIKRLERAASLNEAGIELIPIADEQRLSSVLAERAAIILGADWAVVRLREDGSMRFKTAASYGAVENAGKRFSAFEQEMLAGAVKAKKTVIKEFKDASGEVWSVSSPIMIGPEAVGIITIFKGYGVSNKGFTKEDAALLSRLASFAQRALSSGPSLPEPLKVEAAPFNERPGEAAQAPLPEIEGQLDAFEKRVEQDLNRARRLDKGLVLAAIRIKGLKGIKDSDAFEGKLVEQMKKKTRSFDLVARLDEETFAFLFPDTREKVIRPLALIYEIMASDASAQKALVSGRVHVLHGHATFPRDGDSFKSLFSKAVQMIEIDLKKVLDTGF